MAKTFTREELRGLYCGHCRACALSSSLEHHPECRGLDIIDEIYRDEIGEIDYSTVVSIPMNSN